ncbi:MAG: 1-acyl-sn-glycerol-3-phosphate acyltransferase [Pirellulales bacterium]|nr:1-acyl-sn-glycerol-3-phosphate acyltransferase [Pirellulales bacterium]
MITTLCKWNLRWLLRRNLKVVDVDIRDQDLKKLQSLKGARCLLLPSHSGGFEPYILIYLSKLLREDFHYLAAMEVFEKNVLVGWILQRMGAYSIIRGTADRPSFMMTKRLLIEGQRWLVIFPEGQTVWQNDTVIPFQEGVIQLAFKAYEEIARAHPQESLHCIPISIKYVYLENMDREIDESLARLESQLFPPGIRPGKTCLQRLRDISEAVLAANEKKHGVQPGAADGLGERIQRMKEHIVRMIERQLEINPRSDQPLLDRIRTCFNSVDRILEGTTGSCAYEQKLFAERQQAARDLYHDLWRVLQFVAIYDDYVREMTTVERFMDVLCLLEMELFNQRRMWGPRKAFVKVGEPLDLLDYFPKYKTGKHSVIQNITLDLESSVRAMLEQLAAEHSNQHKTC